MAQSSRNDHPKQYLLLDIPGVLEGEASLDPPGENDLLIRQNKDNSFQILKDGVQIIELLNILASKHNCEIFFHTRLNEDEQLRFLDSLVRACSNKHVKTMAKVQRMFVWDPIVYKGFNPEAPAIINDRPHGIWIAGYGKESEDKKSARICLSKLLGITESEYKTHFIFDASPSVVKAAEAEGWSAFHTKDITLKEALTHIYERLRKRQGQINSSMEDSGDLLISRNRFEVLEQGVIDRKAPTKRLFRDEHGAEWFGKCSLRVIFNSSDSFDDYKEYISSKLYNLFGIKTPDLAFSEQSLSSEIQKQFSTALNVEKPRLHLMSCKLKGLKLLGKTFVENYPKHNPTDDFFILEGSRLSGFGRMMAVAVLLYDYNCVGKAGEYAGYVIGANGQMEIVKIEASEALSFAHLAKENSGTLIPRRYLLETQDFKLTFEQLTKSDQREFARTAKAISEMPDHKIEEIFQRIINSNSNFQVLLKSLLKRKKEYFLLFSPEIQKQFESLININEPSKTIEVLQSEKSHKNTHCHPGLFKTGWFGVPQYDQDCFVGRNDELVKLETSFSAQKKTHILLITGCGGIGKTHLALKYVTNCQRSYEEIIWFNAERGSFIPNQMRMYFERIHGDLAHPPGTEELVKKLYLTFSNKPGKRICIVFDDAQSYEDIQAFLPSSDSIDSFNILITTRNQGWEILKDQTIEIKGFTEKETVEYLEKLIKMDVKPNIHEFNQLLKGLPLAVSQAAAYMHRENIAPEKYCELFREIRAEVFGSTNTLSVKEDETDNMKTVSITSAATVEKLRHMNKPIDSVLAVISFFYPENIPKSMLKDCWETCFRVKDPNDEEESECFQTEKHHNYFDQAINLLTKYSILFERKCLIETPSLEEKSTSITIPRLTQAALRMIYKKEDLYDAYYQKVFRWFLSHTARLSQNNIVRINSRIIPMMVNLCQLKSDLIPSFAEWFDRVGTELAQEDALKDLQTALNHYHEFSTELQRYYAKDPQSVTNWYHPEKPQSGSDYFEKQKDLLSQAAMLLKVYYNPVGIAALTDLADIWGYIGAYQTQIELLTQAYNQAEKCWRQHDLRKVSILKSLARARGFTKENSAKKDLLNQALAILEKNKQNETLEAVDILRLLSEAWASEKTKNGYEKQKDLLIQVLQISEKIHGTNGYFTAIVHWKLHQAWKDLAFVGKQKTSLDTANAILKKNNNKKDLLNASIHLDLFETNGRIKSNYGNTGEPDKKDASRALQILEDNYNEEHSETGDTLRLIGDAWGALGNQQKQMIFLERASKASEKLYCKNQMRSGISLSHVASLVSLAVSQGESGEPDTQAEKLVKAMEILDKYYPEDHVVNGLVRAMLGISYRDPGCVKQALITLKGNSHPLVKVINEEGFDPIQANSAGIKLQRKILKHIHSFLYKKKSMESLEEAVYC